MASRKGSLNKSTLEIKQIFAQCEQDKTIDWVKLFGALYKRSLQRGGDKAAQILVEYKFGKAPQPMEHSGEVGVKVLRINGRPVAE